MKMSLLQNADAWLISLILFVGMMLMIGLGIKASKFIANRSKPANDIKKSSRDISSLNGLLFFLLAFTFGMSGARYESRRALIVEEANDIGTALLRSDLYPDDERAAFQIDFKEYLEARIAYFEEGTNLKGVLAADSLAQLISSRLWHRATWLAKDPLHLAATQQMIPALNTMMDVATTRKTGEKSKVPETIVWMLLALAFATSFYMGYVSVWKGKLDWIVATGFCLLTSFVVFITLDLDRPRRGFITLNEANQTIIDLRKNFE